MSLVRSQAGALMKIYFAGSITGGREDEEVYHQLIAYLQKYGEVLTHHVGDIALDQRGEQANNVPARYIYNRDLGWMDKADVVVSEVTHPSLGTGYELAKADTKGIPVLCLCQPLPVDRRLSALILGNPKFINKTYTILKEAYKYIDEFFAKLKIST